MRLTKNILLLAVIGMMALTIVGCGGEEQMLSGQTPSIAVEDTPATEESAAQTGEVSVEAKQIAAAYHDIYEEAANAGTLGSLEVVQTIVDRLGEAGYAAVDSENQIDMTQAERVKDFCRTAKAGVKSAYVTVVVVSYSGGFTKYRFQTEGDRGNSSEQAHVTVSREDYQYENENLKSIYAAEFPADLWQFTEEGYLLFEGSYFSESYYALSLSDVAERGALRVEPLDSRCRESSRNYLRPVGYGKNNLFLTDWSENEFGDLNFYDLFDRFYPLLYQQPVPYAADENLGVGAIYQVPEELLEHTIQSYLKIDQETLRSKTKYLPEARAYEYRPRGFHEGEYPQIPYPEAVGCEENEDGTLTLVVNAVYPDGNTSKAFAHQVVVRPMEDGSFQYVSNQMLTPKGEYRLWWHAERLTEEEWEEVYGGR